MKGRADSGRFDRPRGRTSPRPPEAGRQSLSSRQRSRQFEQRRSSGDYGDVRSEQPFRCSVISIRQMQAAKLKFHAVARREFPLGGSAGYLEEISKLRGLEILRFSTQTRHPKLCRAMLNHLPEANYRIRVAQMRDEIAAIRGLERAVTIIERTLEEALLSKGESEHDSPELLHWLKAAPLQAISRPRQGSCGSCGGPRNSGERHHASASPILRCRACAPPPPPVTRVVIQFLARTARTAPAFSIP